MKLKILLIWLCMWACDMVPGVSWGTIAFISWIYEQLLQSIKNCLHISSYKLLFNWDITWFWKHIHWNFLITLFSWIIISVLIFSHILEWLLINSPHLVFWFFLWLVLASILVLLLQQKEYIKKWSYILLLLIWLIFAYTITTFDTIQWSQQRRYIVLGWSIAISAMILPWISWSFILLLLWLYIPILTAINNFDIVTILLFIWGILIGLTIFSHTISYVFKKFHHQTISVLIWFMIWALPILRPRQNWHIWNDNEKNKINIENVLPNEYERNSQKFLVVLLFLISFWWWLITFQHLNRN